MNRKVKSGRGVGSNSVGGLQAPPSQPFHPETAAEDLKFLQYIRSLPRRLRKAFIAAMNWAAWKTKFGGGEDRVTSEETPAAVAEDSRAPAAPAQSSSAAEQFTPKQLLALEALARGETVAAAARAADVDRSTVHRWLQDRPFVAELNRVVQERYDERNARVMRLGLRAIETLDWLLEVSYDNERDRVPAVALACKIAGLGPKKGS